MDDQKASKRPVAKNLKVKSSKTLQLKNREQCYKFPTPRNFILENIKNAKNARLRQPKKKILATDNLDKIKPAADGVPPVVLWRATKSKEKNQHRDILRKNKPAAKRVSSVVLLRTRKSKEKKQSTKKLHRFKPEILSSLEKLRARVLSQEKKIDMNALEKISVTDSKELLTSGALLQDYIKRLAYQPARREHYKIYERAYELQAKRYGKQKDDSEAEEEQAEEEEAQEEATEQSYEFVPKSNNSKAKSSEPNIKPKCRVRTNCDQNECAPNTPQIRQFVVDFLQNAFAKHVAPKKEHKPALCESVDDFNATVNEVGPADFLTVPSDEFSQHESDAEAKFSKHDHISEPVMHTPILIEEEQSKSETLSETDSFAEEQPFELKVLITQKSENLTTEPTNPTVNDDILKTQVAELEKACVSKTPTAPPKPLTLIEKMYAFEVAQTNKTSRIISLINDAEFRARTSGKPAAICPIPGPCTQCENNSNRRKRPSTFLEDYMQLTAAIAPFRPKPFLDIPCEGKGRANVHASHTRPLHNHSTELAAAAAPAYYSALGSQQGFNYKTPEHSFYADNKLRKEHKESERRYDECRKLISEEKRLEKIESYRHEYRLLEQEFNNMPRKTIKTAQLRSSIQEEMANVMHKIHKLSNKSVYHSY